LVRFGRFWWGFIWWTYKVPTVTLPHMLTRASPGLSRASPEFLYWRDRIPSFFKESSRIGDPIERARSNAGGALSVRVGGGVAYWKSAWVRQVSLALFFGGMGPPAAPEGHGAGQVDSTSPTEPLGKYGPNPKRNNDGRPKKCQQTTKDNKRAGTTGEPRRRSRFSNHPHPECNHGRSPRKIATEHAVCNFETPGALARNPWSPKIDTTQKW